MSLETESAIVDTADAIRRNLSTAARTHTAVALVDNIDEHISAARWLMISTPNEPGTPRAVRSSMAISWATMQFAKLVQNDASLMLPFLSLSSVRTEIQKGCNMPVNSKISIYAMRSLLVALVQDEADVAEWVDLVSTIDGDRVYQLNERGQDVMINVCVTVCMRDHVSRFFKPSILPTVDCTVLTTRHIGILIKGVGSSPFICTAAREMIPSMLLNAFEVNSTFGSDTLQATLESKSDAQGPEFLFTLESPGCIKDFHEEIVHLTFAIAFLISLMNSIVVNRLPTVHWMSMVVSCPVKKLSTDSDAPIVSHTGDVIVFDKRVYFYEHRDNSYLWTSDHNGTFLLAWLKSLFNMRAFSSDPARNTDVYTALREILLMENSVNCVSFNIIRTALSKITADDLDEYATSNYKKFTAFKSSA